MLQENSSELPCPYAEMALGWIPDEQKEDEVELLLVLALLLSAWDGQKRLAKAYRRVIGRGPVTFRVLAQGGLAVDLGKSDLAKTRFELDQKTVDFVSRKCSATQLRQKMANIGNVIVLG